MDDWLAVIVLIVVVVALVPAMAHALEMPGKRRLDQAQYMAMQKVYYPGFTFAGIAEPVAIILTAILLFVLRDSPRLPHVLVALATLAAAHAAYWLVTHRINKLWLRDEKLSDPGARFFGAGGEGASDLEWTRARDRWEYSHLTRAFLIFIAFVSLVLAVARD